MIRCVLFDVGGVLMKLGEAEYRQGVAERLGLAKLPALYEERVPFIQRGEVDETDVWFEISGKRLEHDAFDDIFEREFPVNQEMLQFAAELRSKGLLTAVLSNTQKSHARVMRRAGLFDGFDRVFLSNEVGARKPEPAVFQRVCEGLSLEPGEIVFIDDVAEYVRAARDFGLQAIRHTGDVAATRARVSALIGEGAEN